MTQDPPDAARRRLAAVWFADLAGYTALSRHDESAALRLVALFQDVAREAAERNGGSVVKFLGDGAIGLFGSVESAARSALALREELTERAASEGLPTELRVGIHLGDVVQAEDGDVYGDGVNTASRIQTSASPGQVLASEDVWRVLRSRSEFALGSVGRRALKGIDDPVRLYEIRLATEDAPSSAERPVRSASRRGYETLRAEVHSRRRLVGGVGIGILVALAGLGLGSRLLDGGRGRIASPAAVDPALDSSIAVLPFANLTDDPANEYFSDGMTEEILAALARNEDLKVISRTSVMQYKGTDKSIRQIGEELGVGTILEGSVRRSGDRVRITAQLINARTDVHIWSESYDRELTDLFAVQGEIAGRIAQALETELSPDEMRRMVAGRGTSNLTAYEYYLKGREYFYRLTAGDNEQAIRLYEQALALDPDFALGLAGLADAYVARASFRSELAWADSAGTTAARALRLDPELPEAHGALGLSHLFLGRLEDAEREYRQAIRLKPSNALAFYGMGQIQLERGRLDQAVEWQEKAVSLEPLAAPYHAFVAWTWLQLGDNERARAWAGQALEIQPGLPLARFALVMADVHDGLLEQAAAATPSLLLDPAVPVEVELFAGELALLRDRPDSARIHFVRADSMAGGEDPRPLLGLAAVARSQGDRGGADRLLSRSGRLVATAPHVQDAAIRYEVEADAAALADDVDAAVASLERAYEVGWRNVYMARMDPDLRPHLDDPRLARFLARVQAEVEAMRSRAAASEAP